MATQKAKKANPHKGARTRSDGKAPMPYGYGRLIDAFDALLASRAPATSRDLASAGRNVVRLIEYAFMFGDFTDFEALAERLLERRRIQWLRAVTHETRVKWESRVSAREGFALSAKRLRRILVHLDDRAADLSVDDVASALESFGKKRPSRKAIVTPAGLAADLAARCGAFGFTKYRPAFKLFAQHAAAEKRKAKVPSE